MRVGQATARPRAAVACAVLAAGLAVGACRPRGPAGYAEPPALGAPVTDPVDGATCPKAPDTDSAVFEGRTYYFCTPASAERFRKDPEKHADRPRPAA
jgi:YHS domain-containing protein